MNIAGVDIKEYDESRLAKYLGVIKVTLICMYLLLSAVVLVSIGGYIKDIVDYGLDYFLEHFTDYYLFYIYLIVGMSVFVGLIAIPLFRYKRGIQTELWRRYPDNTDKKHLEKIAKRSELKFAAFVVGLCVLAAIGGLILGRGIKSGGDDGCTICGKKVTNSFQNSNYCEQHYNEAVLWAIDDVADKED